MDSVNSTATLTIKGAMPSDYDRCLMLDHTISTDYVWQMVINDASDDVNVSFRSARLPRSMQVLYPRTGETLMQSWMMHAVFLVARWGEDVVGYVNIREERAQETAWIADLAVDRAMRRKGVGTALLREARRWAISQELRRVVVETQTKNHPGIQFLKRHGLKFSGYNDLYYPNQDIAVFFGETLR